MEIFSCIRTLMETTPSDLLPCHRHLLDKNFHDLGNAETIQRQIWIASMESALSATFCATTAQIKPGSMAIFDKQSSSTHSWRQWIITHKQSQTTTRPRPNPPRCPRQQTLPVSFWAPPRAQPNRMSPLHFHSSSQHRPHRHILFLSGSGQTCMSPGMTRMTFWVITLPQCSCSTYGGKERQQF